jgi:hypothetical protein
VEGQIRFLVPLLLVFASFLGTLAVYTVLRLHGTETGPIDELVTGLGTAMAALAAPTAIAWSGQRNGGTVVAEAGVVEVEAAPKRTAR